jgi:hypothetical protein
VNKRELDERYRSYRDDESILVRGAVTVAFDPIVVFWKGAHVPLSMVENEIYAHIFRRGRIVVDELDKLLDAIGAKAATRSLLIGHIRQKFLRMGACDPFERLGKDVIRLRVDADAAGRTAPVIGLKGPRYARITSPVE